MANISGTNPLYGGSLYESLLNYDNTAKAVLSLDRNWGTYMHMMIDALSGGTSLPTHDPVNGLYTTVIRPRQERTAQILTRTVSGANLILTWTNNTLDCFRTKETIIDGLSHAVGKVVTYGAGTVTIEPEAGQAAFGSSDFAANSWVTAGWVQSGYQYSTGTTNLYTQKTTQADYVARMRDTYTLTDVEQVDRYYQGGPLWYSYQQKETEMITRYMKAKAMRWWNSKVGVGVLSAEGITSSTRGIRQATQQDGLNMPISSAMSQKNLEDAINNIAEVGTDYDIEPSVMLGNKLKQFINNSFYTNFITYAGAENTLGGSEVVGNNIQRMNVGNIPVRFVMNDMFNDPILNPQVTNIVGYDGTITQYTALVGSFAPIPTIGGGSRPVVQKIHFETKDGKGYRNDLYQPISGMNLDGRTASSPVPGTTWEIMTVSGYSSRMDTFALIEPSI